MIRINKQKTVLLLTCAVCYTFLVSGCKQQDKQVAIKKTGADSVAVFILGKEPVNKQITFPAELTSSERAEIYSKVSGYIKSIKVDIGDRVKQGQVLAILDAPEYYSNYAQANAEVQAARSKLLGSLDTYKRITSASKVDGTIAANELEKVRSQMMADSSSLEAAKEKLNTISQMKDYLTIRAPFSGMITQRNIDGGTLVGSGNTKPLMILEDNSSLRLRIPVPEAYTSAVPDSLSINFTVDAQPGITYKAALSRKAGTLNLTNRTETWEFIYPNKNNELKSGMFANAILKMGRSENSFLVPVTSVATNLEKRFVICLKNGKAEWLDVRTGITMSDKLEIFGSIQEGDTLFTRATDEIKPGTIFIPKFQLK